LDVKFSAVVEFDSRHVQRKCCDRLALY